MSSRFQFFTPLACDFLPPARERDCCSFGHGVRVSSRKKGEGQRDIGGVLVESSSFYGENGIFSGGQHCRLPPISHWSDPGYFIALSCKGPRRDEHV